MIMVLQLGLMEPPKVCVVPNLLYSCSLSVILILQLFSCMNPILLFSEKQKTKGSIKNKN